MATPRLKDKYTKEVVGALKDKFQYKSIMQVPKIEKICINKGMGIAVTDKKLIDVALEEITTITGQKSVSTKSKKAISNFKLRENMPIGVRVVSESVFNEWAGAMQAKDRKKAKEILDKVALEQASITTAAAGAQ